MRYFVKLDPEKVRALAADGLTGPEIAAKMGVTKSAIYQFCDRHGVAISRKRHAPTDDAKSAPEPKADRKRRVQPDALRKAVEQGLSTAVIAKRFGVKSPAIVTACYRHGITPPHLRRKQGEASAAEPQAQDGPQPEAEGRPERSDTEDPCLAHLISTGGTYAALADWAKFWGKTMTQARVAWSKLRLPLRVPK